MPNFKSPDLTTSFTGKNEPEKIKKEIIIKDEVINAYKKFVEQGITNPDALDRSDSEVVKAHELFYKWVAQEDERVEAEEAKENSDQELHHRVNLAKTMLYVDAGFTDPNYLDEVLEWLHQDLHNAEPVANISQRTETRQQIANAAKKIRSLLAAKSV